DPVHPRHRGPRAADTQGLEPAGDGDLRRRGDPTTAGRARRPHRRAAGLHAAAVVLRLHRLVCAAGVAAGAVDLRACARPRPRPRPRPGSAAAASGACPPGARGSPRRRADPGARSAAWTAPRPSAAPTRALPPVAWALYTAAGAWASVYDTLCARVDRGDDLKIG